MLRGSEAQLGARRQMPPTTLCTPCSADVFPRSAETCLDTHTCFDETCLCCCCGCRHDQSEANGSITVLREVKHCEGSFKTLRSCGAPGDGPAYADADTAGQVFASVAPIGQKLFELHKLTVPLSPKNAV